MRVRRDRGLRVTVHGQRHARAGGERRGKVAADGAAPVTTLAVAVVTTGAGTETASSKVGADWAAEAQPPVAATIG